MTAEDEDAAWKNLEDAINRVREVTGEGGILTDWVVVSHVIHDMDDEGTRVSTSVTGARHQPDYRALGLLEYGAAAIRANAVEGDDD